MFEDLDFADYIASLSFKLNYLREKPERLSNEAARVGLKLNARKSLRTEHAKNKERIMVNGEPVEDVETFVYLGVYVDKEGGGHRDRLQKAKSAFQRLRKV